MAFKFKWIVVLHFEDAKQDHQYCLGTNTVYATSEQDAMSAKQSGGKALFAVKEADTIGEALHSYANFEVWVAPQLQARDLEVPAYYERFMVKDVTHLKPGPRKPPTEVEPFWWEQRKVNAVAAMDITRVLCGGTARGA